MARTEPSQVRWVYEPTTDHEWLDVPELITLGYDRLTEALPLADHRHEHGFEFVYMERGQASWEVHGETYTSRTGHIFHTRPDEWHRARMNHIEPCTIWWMIVTDIAACETWLDLKHEEKCRLSDELQQLPRLRTVDPGIRASFRKMRAALEHPGPLTGLQVRHGILDVLLMLLDPIGIRTPHADMKDTMQYLTEHIRRYPEKQWSVKLLASELGVSESHAYRLFRSLLGQSPAAFVDRIKIDLACEVLSTQQTSITELAYDLGFKTSQHFATVFKKYTGHPPSKWRQLYTRA